MIRECGFGGSLLTVRSQAMERKTIRGQKFNLRRLGIICLGKHISLSSPLWTMLAFFPAGDMHDFFVGLMGKRNIQPGKSVWSIVEGFRGLAKICGGQMPYICP